METVPRKPGTPVFRRDSRLAHGGHERYTFVGRAGAKARLTLLLMGDYRVAVGCWVVRRSTRIDTAYNAPRARVTCWRPSDDYQCQSYQDISSS